MQPKSIPFLCLCGLWILCLHSTAMAAVQFVPSRTTPPSVAREFRGLWIATVANIDWPSRKGLTTDAQKAELIAIFDRASELKLNAVILQVRPQSDALYASKIEPWSEFLTGTMGKAPSPFYDPLEFAVTEAHRRGLELHAWFNPYRALHKAHAGEIASNHISRTRPELVKHYGQYLWLDPGERDVQQYSLKVVLDVVNRYDIDGVHFDDYFYPDPAESPVRADFPDEASWRKFGSGGKLDREDWRRQNVDQFIERVYGAIKAAKPWVKFGVSPHGIWRPGNPPEVRKGSFDAYATIYADSRKWLARGWVDYFSPQLYWPIEPKETSFSLLLDWWSRQNEKHRHLWPGISASFARLRNWQADEIPNQIRVTRKEPNVSGYLFYSSNQLLANRSLIRVLESDLLAKPALVPASPWLGKGSPAKPGLTATKAGSGYRFSWSSAGGEPVRWWLVQMKLFSDWKTELLPSSIRSKVIEAAPEQFSVVAIDRFGNASSPSVLGATTPAASPPPAQRRY